ncbi:MAG TPA: ABC transporter ATP-binding protein [Rhodanobacteraceae bacterium]|jgi:lipopolysaccharide transport system ATP-binding protein|nr:ABC transporter ATP-binding protein [Rhodanobacteraceae bacterium]
MSSEPVVIAAQSLGKRYNIYTTPADRLRQMLMPRLQRLAGRPPREYFREFWALREASFTIRRGETIGIIGRNGSGKSTLLQLLCGTLHPSAGEVHTCGRIAALLELGAGFNPDFTGRENVFLSGLLYGIGEAELRARFDSIAAFADIGDFIDQPVKTYSSGMYVRLAFAVAAHVDADILVIDEALSVGDVVFTQKCMRFLRRFQERGTLVFVSHDTSAVTNLCHRAIWLDEGRVRMDGTARDVVEHYLAIQHAVDRARQGERVAVPAANTTPSTGSDVAAAAASVVVEMPRDVVDPRQTALNGGTQRNLIQLFAFAPPDPDRHFGAGAARIIGLRLLAGEGEGRKVFAGGEPVELVVEAEAVQPISAPIIGFHVKDRLGQLLFGDNTYLTRMERPLSVPAGARLRARFRFRMPILPNGDYSVDAALATGTQDDHTQQDWAYDALAFRATESSMHHGLVGIPMHSIELEIGDAAV